LTEALAAHQDALAQRQATLPAKERGFKANHEDVMEYHGKI
jgi:hypothetical protein